VPAVIRQAVISSSTPVAVRGGYLDHRTSQAFGYLFRVYFFAAFFEQVGLMFSATTTGMPVSNSCKVRYRFLLKVCRIYLCLYYVGVLPQQVILVIDFFPTC
jgi:hypothetical protein